MKNIVTLLLVTLFAAVAFANNNPDPVGYKVGDKATDFSLKNCLLYTSPSPRDLSTSRMPSSA